MRTSDKGIAFIADCEGIVTRAYRDPAGVWTIGVGHTAAAGPPVPQSGMAITCAQAMALLADDLAACEARVAAVLGDVAQSVFDGAVSFEFNTGAIGRASWVRALRNGDRAAVEAGLLKWVKARGRTLPGLVRRRQAEARLILDGDYGQPPAAPVSDETRALQKQLAALGLYAGPRDGIVGRETRAAILAYQRRHPDLVADGIAGPATRAALARDLALRDKPLPAAVTTAAATTATAAASQAANASHPALVALAVGAAVLAAAIAVVAWRYRSEIARFFKEKAA
jgi:lysozyme